MPVIKVPITLIVVMCVARSAMTMALADALPLTLQAPYTSNVVHARYLRQTADATTSEQVDSGGGRRLAFILPDLEAKAPAAKLHQGRPAIPLKFSSKAKVIWWLYDPRRSMNPEKAFVSLHLNEVKDNWFESQNYVAWRYYICLYHKRGDWENYMFKTMHKKLGEVGVAKILGQAIGSKGDTADRLRDLLLSTWKGKTFENLLFRLKFEPATSSSSDFEKYAKQFNSPEFTMWAKFVTETRPNYRAAFEALRTDEGDDAIVMRALARTTGENYEFAQNMIYYRLLFLRGHENPQSLFEKLKIKNAWTTVLKTAEKAEMAEKAKAAEAAKAEILKSLANDDKVLIRAWLDYVYMCSLDQDYRILSNLVSQHIKATSGTTTGDSIMKWLISDITASQKRLKPRLESYRKWRSLYMKPSA